MDFKLLQTRTTNYCADTIEWCPIVPYQHYFVCGTYELQNSDNPPDGTDHSTKVRIGQLHLFSVADEGKLCLYNTADVSGVLDCKWYPNVIHDKILLVTANADGRIIVWSFENGGESQPFLANVSQFNVGDEDVLALSVDWSTNNSDVSICVSDSAGYVSVLLIDSKFDPTLVCKLKVHDYEAWIATFDYKNNSLMFTGGDDCLLKLTDVRSGNRIVQLREHTSGVTSIRFNHAKDSIFASGSYDETVKLWDTRKMSRSLSTCEVGGGIWRIKWDPLDAEDILIAGMYSGFFWMKYNRQNDSLSLRKSFKEHASIAYGVDICHLSSEEIIQRCSLYNDSDHFSNTNVKLTATCSFYDKKLCLCACLITL